MLTQTSELAIRSLLLLGLEGDGKPLPPRRIADRLDCSRSYLAKTLGTLARAGVLRAVRGSQGGVLLARDPAGITLLEIVEACQGLLIGNYCQEIEDHLEPVCAFHQAMKEVHTVTTAALSRWTLADLLARPTPQKPQKSSLGCRMIFEGCEKYASGEGGKSKQSDAR
jgi:Rrf2 family protein